MRGFEGFEILSLRALDVRRLGTAQRSFEQRYGASMMPGAVRRPSLRANFCRRSLIQVHVQQLVSCAVSLRDLRSSPCTLSSSGEPENLWTDTRDVYPSL